MPVALRDGILCPYIQGDGPLSYYNGAPLFIGLPYPANANNMNKGNSALTKPPTTFSQSPLGLGPRGSFPLESASYLPARGDFWKQGSPTYFRTMSKRGKPREKQTETQDLKKLECCLERAGTCAATISELRRVLCVAHGTPVTFVGPKIEKRNVHRILCDESQLGQLLLLHLKSCQGKKHECQEIFLALFSVLLSFKDAKLCVEDFMRLLNNPVTSSHHSHLELMLQSLILSKILCYIQTLYDQVERIQCWGDTCTLSSKEKTFHTQEEKDNTFADFKYYQGQTLSALQCYLELQQVQSKLIDFKQLCKSFEHEAQSKSGGKCLAEIAKFQKFMERFHLKVEETFCQNLWKLCESRLNWCLSRLFQCVKEQFHKALTSLDAEIEYFLGCKENVYRQASKLDSFAEMTKRYAAANEVMKEVSRLIESKQNRCQIILDKQEKLTNEILALDKILEAYGHYRVSFEVKQDISVLLQLELSINISIEQLLSLSFQEPLELIRDSLEYSPSNTKTTRKTARFSLNLPDGLTGSDNCSKSHQCVDILSPRCRHFRMKSNPDALLHVDNFSSSPSLDFVEASNMSSSKSESIFSQDTDVSVTREEKHDGIGQNEIAEVEKNKMDSSGISIVSPTKEQNKSLAYAIRTLNLRKLEDLDETPNAFDNWRNSVFRKCQSTTTTPRVDKSSELAELKKTKSSTVVSPTIVYNNQPNFDFHHHRNQRSQSFDDIIVL
eukprot:jgi/Galph1/583/GphlegSOOS_G5341.1